jgi:hypothetical protein
LIARKLAELFSFLAVIRDLDETCIFNDVSRGSVSCLFALASKTRSLGKKYDKR